MRGKDARVPVSRALAPTASAPMRRCPYRCHGLAGAAKAAPTRPLDTVVTHLHVPTALQDRATGQRRIKDFIQ
jgi:hypothetical protein